MVSSLVLKSEENFLLNSCGDYLIPGSMKSDYPSLSLHNCKVLSVVWKSYFNGGLFVPITLQTKPVKKRHELIFNCLG